MPKSTNPLKTQDPDSDPESQTLLHPPSPLLTPTTSITNTEPRYTILKTTLLTSLIWTLLIILTLFIIPTTKQKDTLCIAHTQSYSPLTASVPANWHTQRFNGSLLRLNIFRGDAGADVDAAWEGLGVSCEFLPSLLPLSAYDFFFERMSMSPGCSGEANNKVDRSVLVSRSEAKKSGIREDQVRVTERYGGGYPANVEGLHHLHCLNLLRKSLHWNYDYYRQQGLGAFSNDEYIVRYHVTHCLDILRQQLMCMTDIGVLGQVWWKAEDEEFPQPFVDFNTKHRCRNFEGVRAWAEKHQMPPESEVDMEAFYQMPRAGDTVYSEIP